MMGLIKKMIKELCFLIINLIVERFYAVLEISHNRLESVIEKGKTDCLCSRLNSSSSVFVKIVGDVSGVTASDPSIGTNQSNTFAHPINEVD